MSDVSKTIPELIAEARGVRKKFHAAQLSDSRYLEEDELAKLDAAGYLAVVVANHLADALVAAQGVAPQAPSERTPEFESREQELFKHQPVLSMKDGGIAGCKCMDRVFYNQTEDWGTHLAEVFDALAAPVQPSSTVNEAAITEVINQTIEAMPHARRLYPDVYASEVGRAVVEAIGGESR